MRQLEVIRLAALGHTRVEIAEQMMLSIRTIDRHSGDLIIALGARNMSHAIVISIASEFITLDQDGEPTIAVYGEILLAV
jgi:DNA-binding NarL/FixJ family response regulator